MPHYEFWQFQSGDNAPVQYRVSSPKPYEEALADVGYDAIWTDFYPMQELKLLHDEDLKANPNPIWAVRLEPAEEYTVQTLHKEDMMAWRTYVYTDMPTGYCGPILPGSIEAHVTALEFQEDELVLAYLCHLRAGCDLLT